MLNAIATRMTDLSRHTLDFFRRSQPGNWAKRSRMIAFSSLAAVSVLAVPKAYGQVFSNSDNVTESGSVQIAGGRDAAFANVNGTDLLFFVSFSRDTLSSFTVSNGEATFADIDDAGVIDGAFGVDTADVGGTQYVFVAASQADRLSVYSAADDGTLTFVTSAGNSGSLLLDAVRDVAVAEVNSTTYAYAVSSGEDGISSFSVANNGALTNIENISDDATMELDGAIGATTAVSGGNTFLIVTGGNDDGFSVFQIANDGTLTNTANVGDDATVYLDYVRSVSSAVINGTTYLFFGGWQDDGVSVYSLASDGTVSNVTNLGDDDDLKLNNPLGVSTFTFAGDTYLAVAAQFDGMQLFRVSDAGALTAVYQAVDDATLEISSAWPTAATNIGGNGLFLIGGGFGFSLFSVSPDTTAPRVTSIARQTPATSPTNADSVTWRVTFDEAVNNVGTADFTVTGTTATVSSVTNPSGNAYDVTVSGGDLASLNATVTLSFAGGQDIADTAGNALTNTAPTGTNDNTFALDNTAPRIASIVRQSPSTSPTGSNSLTWRVTFDGAVENVGTADFAVSGTTATVNSAASAGGNAYDVTVSGGNLSSLNATVTLSLAGGQDIADPAGNALSNTTPTGTNEPTFDVDNSGPLVTVNIVDAALNDGDSSSLVTFEFSETVSGFTSGDVTVSNGALSGFTAVDGDSYTATFTASDGTTATGSVTVTAGSYTDAAGNIGATGNDTVAIDTANPVLTAFARNTPASQDTSADTLVFDITFDGSVQNVTADDFTITGTTATGVLAGTGAAYTLTLSGGDLAGLTGTVGLNLAGGQNITDAAGNALGAAEPATDETYSVDNSAPILTAFARKTPSVATTNADTLVFDITFDGAVLNVSADDFTITGTTATGVLAGSGAAYTLTLSGGDLAGLNGTVGLNLAGGQNITDAAGNALGAGEPATDESYSLDNAGPVLQSLYRESPSSSPTNADTLTWRLDFNDPVSNVDASDFSVAGTTATLSVNLPAANIVDVTASGGDLASLDGNVTLSVAAGNNITDAVGNALTNLTGTNEHTPTFTVDNAAPTLTAFARRTPSGEITTADTLVFDITFDGAVQNVSADDFTITGTTATGTLAGSGVAYTLTLSGGDLDGLNGTVGLNLAGGQNITDAASNALAAGEPATDETYQLDHSAPRIASITRLNPAAQETNADTVSWRVTFDEAVTGLSADDFTLTQTTATLAASNITATTVDLTASGGDLANDAGGAVLGIANGQNITDSAGNALTNTSVVGTNDNYFNLDNTPPNVDVIFTDDSASSANSLVVWDISFFENHTGLLISHFDVVTTGTVTVSNLQIVQDNGTNVQVSANLTGDGTAQLTLLPNAPLVDDVGNGNGTNGFTSAYTDTQFSVATVDNTAPTINLFKAGAGSPFTTDPELSIFFSEDVTGFTVDDIVVSGATLSGFRANNARVYFVTVNRVNDGDFTVDIAANVASDGVGNPNTAATQFQGAFDTTPPTVVLSTSATAPVTDTFTINIDFNEDVTGLSEGDFTVVNGSTNNLTGGPRAYTMEIRPTFGAAGMLTVDLGAGGVQDAAELDNTASNQLSLAFDREAPTLTSIVRQTPAGAAIGSSTSSVVFRATFSEDVTNVDVNDWEIRQGGGGVIASVTPVSASVYDITYTLQTASGTIELGITQSGNVSIADTAGNALVNEEATGSTETYERDTQAPVTTSVVSDTAGASPTASDTLTWTVSFNEDISNASADDFALTSTTAAVTNVSTPTARTVTVTASGGDLAGLNGTVTLGLSAGSDLSDAVGNPVASLANSGTDQRSVTVDNTGPTVTVSGPNSTVSAAFSVTLQFDEDVTGFTIDDLGVGNGTAFNFVSNSARFYTATITPAASGNVTIDVAANAGNDSAGNGSAAATRLTVGADLEVPTVVSIVPFDPIAPTTNSDTLMWRVDLSEFVENVWVDDFAVTGTTATVTLVSTQPAVGGLTPTPAAAQIAGAVSFTPSLSGSTFYVQASGGDLASANGSVTLGFAGSQDIADEAGNALSNTTPANNASTYTVDNSAPVLTAFARQTPATQQTDADSLVFAISFNESVANVTADDFVISGTTATGVLGGTGAAYTLTLSGGDLAGLNGEIGLDLAGGQNIVDAAGNPLPASEPATDERYNVLNDAVAPTVTDIVRTAPSTDLTNFDSLAWTVTFSENVANVDASDFAVSGTTASVADVSAASYRTFRVTVSGGDLASLDGSLALSIVASQDIVDDAGNALENTAPTGSNESTYTLDNAAPAVTDIVRAAPSTNLTNFDSLAWTVTFNENVANVDPSDFVVSGTTASVADVSAAAVRLPPSVAGNGLSSAFAVSSRTFRVTVSGGNLASLDGDVTLSFAGSQNITDDAGNGLGNTAPTGANETTYTLDNTAPTVTITSDASAPVTTTFAVTVTFSEAVSGFEAGEIVVDNGSVSDFQAVSASVYTASITPGPEATVRIDVAEGVATDAAGNGNAAPDTFLMAQDLFRALSVRFPGVGEGRVLSDPPDIDCNADCSNRFPVNATITLTAAAVDGSAFAGWTAGPCEGQTDPVCRVTMSADQSVAARFTLDNPPAGRIVASTLPGARSGYVGGPVLTAFLSVVSRTTTPAQSCRVTAPADAPFALSYSQLDSEGNVIGSANPMFDIAAGGSLSFVLGMTPTSETGGYNYLPMVVCENADLDPIVGVNSISLTIGPAPTPDILAVAATVSRDGVIRIPGPGRTFFMSAAAVNIGVGDGTAGPDEVTLTVSADTGAVSLPVAIELCQMDATAACITPRGATVTTVMARNTPVYFAAFVRDTSTNGIPFDPANARVFIRFTDGNGVLRSSTSAAVTAPAPAAADVASALPEGRWSVLMRQADGVWPGLQRASVFVDRNGQAIVANGASVRRTRLLALRGGSEGEGLFALGDLEGVWTADGAIRLGASWSERQGEFWGIGDARSDADDTWLSLAGRFGEDVRLTDAGELRGQIVGCALYGETGGSAGRPVTVTLSGCASAGDYLAVIDLPANDNEQPALLVAGEDRGWRLVR